MRKPYWAYRLLGALIFFSAPFATFQLKDYGDLGGIWIMLVIGFFWPLGGALMFADPEGPKMFGPIYPDH